MKYLLIAVIAFFSININAQDCKTYLYLQANKTVELSHFKNNGKPNGKQIYRITNVANNGNEYTSQVTTEMFSEKGKLLMSSSSKVKCSGGVYSVDMTTVLSVEEQKKISTSIEKAYLLYPSNVAIGQKLEDGLYNVIIEPSKDNPFETTVNIEVKDRLVVAKETITSPASTWDCFKITSKYKNKFTIAGIGIPIKLDVTEWFCPGIGIVKTETKLGSSLITAIK